MPNDSRLSSALQTRKAQKKRPPKKPAAAPKPDPIERAVVTMGEIAKQQVEAEVRSQATMEVLQHILQEERTVTVEAGQLDDVISRVGDTIAAEIAKIPAPIVNIPKREPIPYRVTPEYDRHGRMVDAMIVPVVDD